MATTEAKRAAAQQMLEDEAWQPMADGPIATDGGLKTVYTEVNSLE